MNAVERHFGKRPVIYTTPDFFHDNLVGAFPHHEFWLRSVAGHPSDVYPTRRHWRFWQYTGTGIVPGIDGKTDINAFGGTQADWQAWLQSNQVGPARIASAGTISIRGMAIVAPFPRASALPETYRRQLMTRLHVLAALAAFGLSCSPALAQQAPLRRRFWHWLDGVVADARAAGVGERGLPSSHQARLDQNVIRRTARRASSPRPSSPSPRAW